MSLVQTIDWVAVGPPLVTALAAIGLLLADVVGGPGPRRRGALAGGALTALVLAGALLVPAATGGRATFCVPPTGALPAACSYVVDALTVPFQALVLAGAAVVVLLSVATVRDDRLPAGEYWFLLLASVTGALVLAAGRDLLTLIVALEVVTLPTYALVGLRRDDPRSSQAALTLFLVSVASSAVALYGVALVYGATGQVFLSRIAEVLAAQDAAPDVLAVGVLLSVAGFGFKVAAVPFHTWAPDTYVGAPLPVAAYLSVVSKAAGFAGLVLLLAVAFPAVAERWAPAVGVLAALTMSVGNLVALRQRQVVRLLAWSSIAQSGYVLLPLATVGSDVDRAAGATVTYVLAYAAMNLAAFAVVARVGRSRPAQRLADYRGLARRDPFAATALGFALLCLAGLPPGVLGLVAKVVVLEAPVAAGAAWLAVVMVVNIVVGLAYYLRWGAALLARDGVPAASTGTPASEPAAAAAAREAAAGTPASKSATGTALAAAGSSAHDVPARDLGALADRAAIAATFAVTVVLSVAPGLVVGVLSRGAAFPG